MDKRTGRKIQWKKVYGKITAEMGRQHQWEIVVVAKYKVVETISRDRDIWRPGPDMGCRTMEEN